MFKLPHTYCKRFYLDITKRCPNLFQNKKMYPQKDTFSQK